MPLDMSVELCELDLTPVPKAEASIGATILAPSTPEVVEALAPMADDRSAFYASLGADEAAKLRAATGRVTASMSLIGKNILVIGCELVMISNEMPGHFEEWLKLEFEMSRATAYNYINVAKQFSKVPATVEALPSTTVYKLAAKATPAEVRDAVVREIAAGEVVSAKEVESRIASAKTRAAEDKRIEANRQLQEQQRLADERGWNDKVKEMTDAGRTESEIAVERKKWDGANARKERVAQQKVTEQERQRDDYRRQHEAEALVAASTADLLRQHLPDQAFEALKQCACSYGSWSALSDTLKNVPA